MTWRELSPSEKEALLQDMIHELRMAFVEISSEEDCIDLLRDLCTPKEIEQMAQRFRAAKLLMDKKTYTQVIDESGISSATLSRVSRCVQEGKGYRNFVK